MLNNMSIRLKILLSATLLVLVAVLTGGIISLQMFKSALTERMEKYELLRTVESVRNSLDAAISVPLAQARQHAANTFILDWMAAGEPADDIPAWKNYAIQLKKVTDAASVAWISEKTLNYYDDELGLSRKIDPKGADGWFKSFLDSGRNSDFNLGIEPGKTNVTLFVNALAKDKNGNRAIASLGFDVTAMADVVRNMQIGKTGKVFVVDESGKIQLHWDTSLVKVDNKIDMRSLPGMAPIADQLLNRANFNLAHYEGPNGAMVIASSHLPNARWFVVVELAESEVYAAVTRTMAWLLIANAIVILLSIGLVFLMSHSITRPLDKMRNAMLALTSGHGDLTSRLHVDGKDEISQIATAFNTFMEQLHGMFQSVHKQAGHLHEDVEKLNTLTVRMADASHENAHLAESTAATIEQLTVSISHIAANTAEASASTESASRMSLQSTESVQRVSGEIGAVAQAMETLTSEMSLLEDRSRQVGTVAAVIKEIADQTNLLALNAAIEAARAGEQGRGFAVVADEVRKLAERTSQATVEIDQMVTAMRQSSEGAKQKVYATNTSVKTGVGLVDVALKHISQIEMSMNEVKNKTLEIRDAAAEQSVATEEMAKSAEKLSDRAQRGDAEIQHAHHVIKSLEQMSVELNKVVGRFKL